MTAWALTAPLMGTVALPAEAVNEYSSRVDDGAEKIGPSSIPVASVAQPVVTEVSMTLFELL